MKKLEMDLLISACPDSEWDNSFNCVRIYLDENLIKRIFRLSRKAGKNNTVTEFESSPVPGNTTIDFTDYNYRNIEDLSSMMGDDEIFKENTEVSVDVLELYVDNTDFWWTGQFKHSGGGWRTRMIPLSILPQELRIIPPKKTPQELSPQQIEEILTIARSGIEPLTPGTEIPKHITRAHLFQVIKLLLKKDPEKQKPLTNKQIGEIAVLCNKFSGDTQILIVCIKDKAEDLINKLKNNLEETYQKIISTGINHGN